MENCTAAANGSRILNQLQNACAHLRTSACTMHILNRKKTSFVPMALLSHRFHRSVETFNFITIFFLAYRRRGFVPNSDCALERESFWLHIARANNTKSYRMKNISFINFGFHIESKGVSANTPVRARCSACHDCIDSIFFLFKPIRMGRILFDFNSIDLRRWFLVNLSRSIFNDNSHKNWLC